MLASSASLVSAKITINGNENVVIHKDLTYDISFTFDFSSAYFFDEKNWSFDFDKNLENVIIYDDAGLLDIHQTREETMWKTYFFDARYGSKGLPKRIYVNATGKLVVPNDKIARLTYGTYTFEGGKIFDYLVNMTVRYPSSLSFISADVHSKINSSAEDTKGIVSRNYLNPGAYRALAFFQNDARNDFVEMSEGTQTFLVQNESVLLSAFSQTLPHIALIKNYPLSQNDTLTIVRTPTQGIEYQPDNATSYDGSYVTDNMILLSDQLTGEQEISSVLLHELTHYAQFSSPSQKIYGSLEWLKEGEAVYTEIMYEAQRSSSLSDSANLQMYQRKIDPVVLEHWYQTGKEFSNSSESDGFSAGELYSIYGFVINHYVTTFGAEAFYTALQKTTDQLDAKQRDYNEFASVTKAETLLLKNLAEASGKPLQREDIFFPERGFFLSNKEQFDAVMEPFVAEPLSGEKSNPPKEKLDAENDAIDKQEKISLRKALFILIIFMAIIGSFIVLYKFSNKLFYPK